MVDVRAADAAEGLPIERFGEFYRRRPTGGRGRRHRVIAMAIFVVASLIVVPSAFGTSSYSHDASRQETHASWMAGLADSLQLSALSIPGTHDSGARLGVPGDPLSDSVQTQSMTIGEQLQAGIRAFDIRLDNRYVFGAAICDEKGHLWVGHSVFCQLQEFDQVLATMNQFLTTHGTEAILMAIRQELEPTTDEFATDVQRYLDALPPDRIYDAANKGTNPTVADIQGKIVIFNNSFTLDKGIGWDKLDQQNAYNVQDNWHLATKWNGSGGSTPSCDEHRNVPDKCDNVVRQFERTLSLPGVIFGNFLSGSSGGFPYFFASGKSSPGTNAPALLTGWTRGIINTCAADDLCLHEYPNVDCCLGTFAVQFKGINQLATEYLRAASTLTRAGIVWADFPGADLIDAIIDVNPGIDLSAPFAQAELSSLSPANGDGWFNHDVTVTWHWSDSRGAGIDPGKCTSQSTSSGEGDAVVLTATCADKLGHVGTASVTLKIDKTPPKVSVTNVTAGAQYLVGAVPQAGCDTSDSLSGVQTRASLAVTTSGSNGVGSFAATCSGAVDKADNHADAVTVSFTVVYGFGGFLPPLQKSKSLFKPGSTIPVKFVLTDASGNPIPASIAAALAAAGEVKATLAGQGITPVSTRCTWDILDAVFHCNIKTPKVQKLDTTHPYTITASENVTGAFVTAPGVGTSTNPKQIFFK